MVEDTVPLTPNDLTNLFKQLYGVNEKTATNPEYKYVIYVRKSTDEKERQARSFGDQIKGLIIAMNNSLNFLIICPYY